MKAGFALYRNVLQDATNQPTGGETLTDDDTANRWFPVSGETLEYTNIPATLITHVGVAAHNLGSTGNSLVVESFDGSSWFELVTITAAHDQSVIFSVPSTTTTGLRIKAQGNETELGIVYIGEPLQMERPIYQGHTPGRFSDNNTLIVKNTGGGQYAGNQLRRAGRSTNISLENLTPQWVRNKFEPFRQHYNKGGRFFYSWRPDKFSDEVAYARGSGTITPTNAGPRDLMSLSFDVVEYRQTHRPDMIKASAT